MNWCAPKLEKLVICLLAFVLCLSSCRSKPQPDLSRQYLRDAMIALNNNDDVLAEQKLLQALNVDPKNAKARVALASIYAKRGKVSLKDWLDPFLEAGKQIKVKSDTLKKFSALLDLYGQKADEKMEADMKGISKNVSMTFEFQQEAMDRIKKRTNSMGQNIGKMAFIGSTMMDIFQGIPMLREEDLDNIHKAVDLLVREDKTPENRSEEVRVYLAILSMVRVVHHFRNLIGIVDKDTGEFFSSKNRFCDADEPHVKKELESLRIVLGQLEEGLRVRPNETLNPPRKIRSQIHDFIITHITPIVDHQMSGALEKGSEAEVRAQYLLGHICQNTISAKATLENYVKKFKKAAQEGLDKLPIPGMQN